MAAGLAACAYFFRVSGNERDALIDLLTVDATNNLYRIKMINHNLYLTPASNSSGAALTWENASNADNQIWQLCASQSSGGGSTGGSTTITMPVNANQNYSGTASPARTDANKSAGGTTASTPFPNGCIAGNAAALISV